LQFPPSQERAETGLADAALSQVLVFIQAGAGLAQAVIQVDKLDAGKPDRCRYRAQRPAYPLWGIHTMARYVCVAGIEANADAPVPVEFLE
jgi:hypothetical protein